MTTTADVALQDVFWEGHTHPGGEAHPAPRVKPPVRTKAAPTPDQAAAWALDDFNSAFKVVEEKVFAALDAAQGVSSQSRVALAIKMTIAFGRLIKGVEVREERLRKLERSLGRKCRD